MSQKDLAGKLSLSPQQLAELFARRNRPGTDEVVQAVTILKSALEVIAREQSPKEWALNQEDLGVGPLSNNVVRFSPNPVLSGPPSVLNQRGTAQTLLNLCPWLWKAATAWPNGRASPENPRVSSNK